MTNYTCVCLMSLLVLVGCQPEDNQNQEILDLAYLYLQHKNKGADGVTALTGELEKMNGQLLEPVKQFVVKTAERAPADLFGSLLQRPSDEALRHIYRLRTVMWNSLGTERLGVGFVDTLDISGVASDEMLSAYYRMVFVNVPINIHRPEDFSDFNIDLDQLGLKNDQEKAIAYFCLAKPFVSKYLHNNRIHNDDCNKALTLSNTFPKVNGQHLFGVTPPRLKDFSFMYGHGSEDQSFKAHFTEEYHRAVPVFQGCN